MKEPHKYRNLPTDKQEELFSNYLVDSWSFSQVAAFARNEKAFEMSYIYRQPFKRSASEVAGSAYHSALDVFFADLMKDGTRNDLSALQLVAFAYIDTVPANKWKTQKTTPTVEECIKKATLTSTSLLENFFSDISVYMDELKEIIAVEVYCNEFLTINGVDIPLPCHSKIDLIIRTTNEKIVIIDHKSKTVFTDEKELKFSIGKQAITYVKNYEVSHDLTVDEVWFIENKSSQNRDKSPQVNCFKIEMTKDVRRLYEAMLYEPLKRMLEAVSNPDYVYLINENDNFVDKAEIYEFWAQTMLAEVDDFAIPESKRELMSKRLKKIRDSSLAAVSPNAIKKFRANASEFITYDLTNKNMAKEEKIEHTLRTLGVVVKVAHKFEGYSSDTFLVEVSGGTNLASVMKYKLDIASALNVSSIRMMKDLFVHEGRSYLAIESGKVRDKDLLFDPKYLQNRKIPIGLDNFGNTIFWDLDNPSTPHTLICGSTGSGKSVCIVSIIEYAKLSGVEDIIVFDPKFEFNKYKSINEISDIESKMESLVNEMNQRVKSGTNKSTLVIFDEFADAVSAARSGSELDEYELVHEGFFKNGQPKMKRVKVGTKKSLEENLKILLQKGRSCGFRIVAATQRASVKVITGDAKVNFPVQICFKVPKEVDSKVVIDEPGAESLSGKGDGLINSPDYQTIVRFQGFYKN